MAFKDPEARRQYINAYNREWRKRNKEHFNAQQADRLKKSRKEKPEMYAKYSRKAVASGRDKKNKQRAKEALSTAYLRQLMRHAPTASEAEKKRDVLAHRIKKLLKEIQ